VFSAEREHAKSSFLKNLKKKTLKKVLERPYQKNTGNSYINLQKSYFSQRDSMISQFSQRSAQMNSEKSSNVSRKIKLPAKNSAFWNQERESPLTFKNEKVNQPSDININKNHADLQMHKQNQTQAPFTKYPSNDYAKTTNNSNIKVQNIESTWKSAKKKEQTNILELISELFLSPTFKFKTEKYHDQTSNLIINSKGFYNFLYLDFKPIIRNLRYVEDKEYLRALALIPKAEAERVCLPHLKNSFNAFVNRNRMNHGFPESKTYFLDCNCHSNL